MKNAEPIRHHVYRDTHITTWPCVTIIKSKCIEHGVVGSEEITPGCGREIQSFRVKQQPQSSLVESNPLPAT